MIPVPEPDKVYQLLGSICENFLPFSTLSIPKGTVADPPDSLP